MNLIKVTANQKYIRTSPRKLRLIADSIRHLTPLEARRQLQVMPKRGADVLFRVIGQAIANATHNSQLVATDLVFAVIEINESPTLKRFRAVSRGQAHSIHKRASHIKVILTTKALKEPVISKSNKNLITEPQKKMEPQKK